MRVKKRTVALLVSFFLILVWAISPGPVTAEEKHVTTLFTGPLTGPGASLVLPIYQGWKDYITELNSKGGVDGIKIKLRVADDRYDVSRAVSFYMRNRKAPRLVLLLNASTPPIYALYPIITRDKLPAFSGGSRFAAKPGHVFLVAPPYQDQFGGAMDWMAADWKKKGNSGMPTVGLLA